MIRLAGMNLTEWFLFGTWGVLTLLVELAAVKWPHLMPVITKTMRNDGLLWAAWPFLFGFIPGHIWSPWWLRFEALRLAQPWSIPLIAFLLLAFDVLGPKLTITQAFFVVPLAYVAGSVFWNTAALPSGG